MMCITLWALQVCVLTQTAYLMCTAQDDVDEPTVTALHSSVMTSGRTFACENEEVVYRCVSENGNPGKFSTAWSWAGEQIATFDSNQTVGKNGTCNAPTNQSLAFLHSTLVSTNSTTYTCVSLLIVIPSLTERYIDFNERNTIVECAAFDDRTPSSLRNNMAIKHNISGKPEWNSTSDALDQLKVDYTCYHLENIYNFLLNISWPQIINTDRMDFDVYTLWIDIFDSGERINSSSAQTVGTEYQYMFQNRSPLSNDMIAQVKLNAINRCKDMCDEPLQVNLTLDQDRCKEHILVGSRNDCCSCNVTPTVTGCPGSWTTTSSQSINYLSAIMLAGVFYFILHCYG